MKFDWLTVCADGQTTPCIPAIQAGYLAVLVIGVVILILAASRARDLSISTLALMPVAIAINIAVGSIVVALRLPIYLDSIGTVLVGVLGGPLAGALTGLLSNLIWSILPVPGGAGPTIAFFAPVAGVIGLLAGFWSGRGIFRLRADDTRVGGFLALALAIGVALVAMLVVQQTVGLGFTADDLGSQTRFVALSLAIIVVGAGAGWLSSRTIFVFSPGDSRIRSYLTIATGLSAGAIAFVIVRLLFGPTGYFSTVTGTKPDGTPDTILWGANLTGLAIADNGGLIAALVVGLAIGALASAWAGRGDNARLFPVWIGGLTTGFIAATISAPIAAGVFGGVTGAGTDLLVAAFRTLGLGVFQSTFAQGLTSDPLDKTISFTIVFIVISALPMTVRTMFSRGDTTVAAT
jgi:energy-coupling factor transport system substrate-specific component